MPSTPSSSSPARPSSGSGQGYGTRNDVPFDEVDSNHNHIGAGSNARQFVGNFTGNDEANVRLLPAHKPDEDVDSSDEDYDEERCSVSEQVEKVLMRDGAQRAYSIDTDLEDNSSFILDSVHGEYGVHSVKTWLDRAFRLRSWRQIVAVGVVGALLLIGVALLQVLPFSSTDDVLLPISWFPTPRGGTHADWRESYVKAKHLVDKMTLPEKVNITTGTGWQMGLCVGNTGPAELVEFPSLCLQDGPLGVRFADNITAFPAGITTGATWNRELMRSRGLDLGQEAKDKGVSAILGPSIGPLGMLPAGGRNWEGFGSDPVLQAVAAVETIRGIQENGVMATAKHLVLNEQEHFRRPYEWDNRFALSSNIDDRSLHEIFVWPFAESIRAGVASVMCSYQMVNNSYSCENSKLLNGILKDELGFQGFVQSDWLAQRSGVNSTLGGLDMSMPGDGLHWADGEALWGQHLTRSTEYLGRDSWPVKGPNFSSWTNAEIGRLHEGSPDDKTTEVVNHYAKAQGDGPGAHSHIARQVAAEGMVLLKNIDNVLPLSRNVSIPLDRNASTPKRKFRVGIFGEDAGPGRGPNACPNRGCNQGTLATGWGSGAVDFPYLVSPWEALRSLWPSETVETRAYLTNNVSADDIVDQDLCLVFANADGGEGFIRSGGVAGDRNDLYLQQNGTHLAAAVGEACGGGKGKVVVIIHSIGPVVLDLWVDLPGVHAVILANLPGQESGNALADVLFGDVDASGRLPYTIDRRPDDYGPAAQVLFETQGQVPQVNLTDSMYVDYRHFDLYDIAPRYEFGFGLSYTTFSMSDLRIVPLQYKTRLPSTRAVDQFEPPAYDLSPPNASSALMPSGFRALEKYIYPYLESLSGTEPGQYPYPEGYYDEQVPSAAGGTPGGNPSLYGPMLDLAVKVANTGDRPGKEVVQIYVSFPANVTEPGSMPWSREPVEFPYRVLRNFDKVSLDPGQTTTVNLTLTRKDLSYWSSREQNWVLPTEGKFGIWAGRSSRDLPIVAHF